MAQTTYSEDDVLVQQDQERQNASRLRMSQIFAQREALAEAELKRAATAAVTRNSTKILLRFINFGSAATIFGLVITFLFMNTQLLLGNLAGLPFFKEIKLDNWEIVIIIVLDALLAVLFLLQMAILIGLLSPLIVGGQVISNVADIFKYSFSLWMYLN